MRLVHVADVHLDTVYGPVEAETRERLRRSAEAAFVSVVDLCLRERVHALLVAGDLWEGSRLTQSTEMFLHRQLSRLQEAGVAVLIAAGNHDPGPSLAVLRDWAGVELFADEEPRTVTLCDGAGEALARVTGCGHGTARVAENLAARYPVAEPGLAHVGLLHGLVDGADGGSTRHDRYAPCGRQDLARTGYAYWALGHVHRRQAVPGLASAWYPGNLQGRHIREVGSKGALLVEIAEGTAPRVRFQPLARARFEDLLVTALDDVADLDGLRRVIHAALQRRQEADPGLGEQHEWFVRVRLSGRAPLAAALPVSSAARELERKDWERALAETLDLVHLELVVERFQPPLDLSALRAQPHLLGEALRLLEELRQGDDLPSELQELVLLGKHESTEKHDGPNSRLRGVLEGLDEDLVRRMQAEIGS